MAHHRGTGDVAGEYEVGVVGAGHITMHYHLPVLDHLDATSVAYVADIDPDRAGLAANVYDSESHVIEDASALPACDAALLATPMNTRERYVREFAARDTPMFAEKPFAVDLETHERFLDLTDDIACNYTRVEYGTSGQMRRLVGAEPFGELTGVEVRKGIHQTSTGKTESQIDPEARGGQLHEQGSHLLSQLSCVLPGYGFEVADAAVRWNRGIDIDTDAEIRAERNGDAVPVSFELSLVRELPPRIACTFERATVRYDPSTPTGRLEVLPDDGEPALGIDPPDGAPDNHEQAIADRWRRFLSALDAGTLDPDRQTGIEVSRLISGIYDAAGRWPGGAG